MGGSLTSVVQNNLTKGCTSIMLSPNTDMIAVSFACPIVPRHIEWGLLELLVSETPGKSRRLERLCNSSSIQLWHFLHLLIYTKPGPIVSDYHPLFYIKVEILLLFIFFGFICIH